MTGHQTLPALSVAEAAARLGVSQQTLRRWADKGYVRVSRTPGGQRRFTAEALDEFVRSLEQMGAA